MNKRSLDFYSSRNKENIISDLSHFEDLVDAEIRGDRIYFITSTGKILETRSSPKTRDLYWRIKLRNRRKAFGL